jgi:hypothetical protein
MGVSREKRMSARARRNERLDLSGRRLRKVLPLSGSTRRAIVVFAFSRGIRSPGSTQKGASLLIMLLLVLGIGLGVLAGDAARWGSPQPRTEMRTLAALAEAKQALIGRAVADDDRPGSLPCPDALTNVPGNEPGDGIADVIVGTECPSYIGRLPWKTLGLTDLRDEYGERLWYALSPKFRDHAAAQPINSDTKADTIVFADSAASTLTAQAVAVIFAPGMPLSGQQRDGTSAPCAVTGTTILRTLCATNYLDVAAGVNNASASGPYITAQPGDAFNDRIAVLTTADLMPLVEMRVATELRTVLVEYKAESVCQCYPWAAADTSGISIPGLNRGRIPSTLALPENWGLAFVPVLPAWFVANRWSDVIYYAAGKTSLELGGLACVTCVDPTLTVDGIPGYTALVLTPGPAGNTRPSAAWSNYFEDAQNSDGLNDVFVTPTSNLVTRDRLLLMASGTPLQCAANAQTLLQNAPCELKKARGTGIKKKTIRPECSVAAANLSVCPCSAAANTLLAKPCSKKLKTRACQTAVAALKTCS